MDKLYDGSVDLVKGNDNWRPRAGRAEYDNNGKILMDFNEDLSYGYMSGYVGRTQTNYGSAGVSRIVEEIAQRRLQWGPVHELGHNMGEYPKFDVEWTATFIGLYASAVSAGVAVHEKHNGTFNSLYNVEYNVAIQDKGVTNFVQEKLTCGLLNFARTNGWQAIKKAFGSYHDGSYPYDGSLYAGDEKSISFYEFIDRIEYFSGKQILQATVPNQQYSTPLKS